MRVGDFRTISWMLVGSAKAEYDDKAIRCSTTAASCRELYRPVQVVILISSRQGNA